MFRRADRDALWELIVITTAIGLFLLLLYGSAAHAQSTASSGDGACREPAIAIAATFGFSVVVAAFVWVIWQLFNGRVRRICRRWFTEVGRLRAQHRAIRARLDRIAARKERQAEVEKMRIDIERDLRVLANEAYTHPQHFNAPSLEDHIKRVTAYLRALFPDYDAARIERMARDQAQVDSPQHFNRPSLGELAREKYNHLTEYFKSKYPECDAGLREQFVRDELTDEEEQALPAMLRRQAE